MCCCDKPNVNGTPGYSWNGKGTGTYPVAPPTLQDRDVLLFDEPGRCGGLDSHSHHYRLVRNCGLFLLVRHGGGEERFYVSLPYDMAALDSTARYWILNAVHHAYRDGCREGTTEAATHYQNAFVEGRLRKRKMPGRDAVKVWIEPKPATLAAAK